MAGHDPYRYFRVEAAELIEQIGQCVLELEQGPADAEVVARLLRQAHTLKGAARVVRQSEIADHAHAMEDALAGHRDTAQALPPGTVAHLLALVDGVNARIAQLAGLPPDAATSTSAATTTQGRTERSQAFEPLHAVRVDSADVDRLLDAIGEAKAQVLPLRRGTATLDRVRRSVELLVAQSAAPSGPGAAAPRPGATRDRVSSIGAEIDVQLAALSRSFGQAVERAERELQQVRTSAEQLRLAPAGAVFGALHRAVRDAADLQGKRVVFDCVGGDIRLDPQVLSAAYGALLHVVRNAVVHGIEAEPDRVAAGKPTEGRIALEVARRDGRVVFACRDDGRGFDLDAVRRAAERGGLSTAATAALDPQQLVGLVLRGGISTTSTVTEVSGRGVGLDVVRDVAERLGGEVAVSTNPGTGTTVELVLPLLLVSLDCMIAEVAGGAVAVPLDAVRHSLRLLPAEIARSTSGATVTYDGAAVALLPLAAVLPAPAGTPPDRPGSAVVALVVSVGRETVAIGVDRLLGTAAVVVRGVPEPATAGPVVGGLWLDGEGNPRVLLDPGGVVAEARRGSAGTAATGAAGGARPPRRAVLVIDDSLTTRMLERSILESAGYDVDVAASGEEALDKARSGRYGLFLVDVEMPGMDGFTFIERTRADDALRDIPSILISSRCSPDDYRRGAEVGARMYVAKSEFDQNKLLAEIGKLVG